MQNIEKSILTTVVLADIFNMPLKANKEFLDALEKSEILKKKIHRDGDLFYLDQNVIVQKERHDKTGVKKWDIVRKFIKFFRCIPFAQEIFVSGSLARGNTVEGSDIDLLIITKHGKIWTARMFIYLITFVACRHRHGSKIKDRFCLNHFISDKDLEIKHQSLYNAETYLHLVPLLQNKDVINNFRQANQWVKKYFPYSDGVVSDDAISCEYKGTVRSQLSDHSYTAWHSGTQRAGIKKILEFILGGFLGNVFEWVVRKIQTMKQSSSRKNDVGGRIILSDSELEFHPDSPEGGVMEKFQQRLCELGVDDYDELK
ncbi:nucleotidyltransferase domain-containing protein [bacterium]|nr:MAG: nucleotidyltransferase domain-containing protein [bacterium]